MPDGGFVADQNGSYDVSGAFGGDDDGMSAMNLTVNPISAG